MSVLKIVAKVASQRQRQTTEPKPELDPRHLAIAGVSYCGSTLLARILGSLPEVANVGESHWLTARRQDGRTVPADLEHEDYSLQVQCDSCGRNCEVLNREFRLELQRDPSDWYRKIGRQLGGKILVSADKNLSKLKRHDPDLHMDALVVFKSPAQACYSHLTKVDARQGRAPTAVDVGAYLDTWARAYAGFLDNFPNRGRRVFMSFERFCVAPHHHIEVICEVFDLRFEARVLKAIRSGQHCLGGNRRVNRWFRERTQVEINPVEAHELSQEQLAIVARHKEANGIYHALCFRHDEVFSSSVARPNQDGPLIRTSDVTPTA